MPQLANPTGIRSRPVSVVVGELAIAAGLLGESVTVASDFPASTLCQGKRPFPNWCFLERGIVLYVNA